MILTSRLKNNDPIENRGLLLKATSKDLINWTMDEEPFYAPHAYYAHECPDIFKIGDWYYMIFSEFCDRYVTTYRMAKSLKGPWINPKIILLMVIAFTLPNLLVMEIEEYFLDGIQ